ncbi:MAG: DUF554 family protein [Oscillospiraceae bacterium]|jgi:uncharacterized membrane protein YqgA involved in biofilm formation|nr:DUF554 family protein [Oscillospiraceae bacterium]
MPIGAIVNSGALAAGAFVGAALGARITGESKLLLTNLMGVCAIAIAVVNIVKLHSYRRSSSR